MSCWPRNWQRSGSPWWRVEGGDARLKREYAISAVGKLGVVLAEGRSARLVVDSSVSGVTSNTVLPNRSSNPTLSDVFSCMPLSDSLARLVALVLDVAKAHRRKQDRGLLCFRRRNVLYQCTTLNFGARVSSFFWARAAGLLVRLIHRLLRVRHSAQIYMWMTCSVCACLFLQCALTQKSFSDSVFFFARHFCRVAAPPMSWSALQGNSFGSRPCFGNFAVYTGSAVRRPAFTVAHYDCPGSALLGDATFQAVA